jgi:hypothetical protein
VKNNNNELKRKEYECMVKSGKVLMNGAKMLVGVDEQLVLLIHLIITCITFYGCFYEELLK